MTLRGSFEVVVLQVYISYQFADLQMVYCGSKDVILWI